MKNLQPLNDKILIKVLPEEDLTQGGLYIPDTAKAQPCRGEVLEVGTGVELSNGEIRPIPLNKGDLIIFTQGRGVSVKLDDDTDDYLIVGIKDILGKYERN